MTTSNISAIALDLGTTSIKAGLLNRNGTLGHIAALAAPKITAADGRYESDALAYAEAAEQVLGECLDRAGDCQTLGLCSQRSSFLIWERASGQPVTPLISWQDNRGAASCDALRAHEPLIRDLTGLPLTPYYFAPKLRGMLRDDPQLLDKLEGGEWLAGTLDTFLIWRWTGGKHFMTDASMAARTLLMDIHRQQWSPQLRELFNIPSGILPEIKPSAGLQLQLDTDLILQASVGDQSAALFASLGADCAGALVNLGTGCFVVRYLPDGKSAPDGYLHTMVYQDSTRQTHLAIEGTLNSIAAALAPYPVGACRIEDLAADDIFCLAEPSGIGAPYFRSDLGLRFSQPVEHLPQQRIACLLLEAVIFRVARILEDFHRTAPLERVYLAGGLSGLACLQQGITQCAPCAVYRLSQNESSLQGAALLAAGMAPAFHREAEKISAAHDTQALPEKYRRWKEWFDALLEQPR
ncbi:MAG: FGGY family carbohydrate kinase [Gallionella sp.]|nr:FGGY family carbohydrate kinase [Gallionella sp.]